MKNIFKPFSIVVKPKVGCVLLFFLVISAHSLAQQPHEHPDHPKGNSADQYQALPHYNEACELYKNGEIKKAKSSLYEAVSISFALTEAQLFLADILYEEGIRDSALCFYKSGIDFAIEQQPYYYFRLFELGVEQGQYHIVRQNLKYFHQLYQKKGYESPYQTDFPFDRSDYEFYEDVLELVYDYKSWQPFAEQINTYNWIAKANNQLEYRYSKGHLETLRKSSKEKWRKIRGISSTMNDFFLRSDGKIVFTNEEEGRTVLYCGTIKGNKLISSKRLPETINFTKWNSTPFLGADNVLYYSVERDGQRDIVAVEINNEGNCVGEVFELNRINTSGNEFAPFFDEENKIFFFTSDSRPGFGRNDIFQCNDFEVFNKFINPFNERNCGATINSNVDNISITSVGSVLYSTHETQNELRTKKMQRIEENEFIYELGTIKRTQYENE
ncbi:MAG: hypothetical protein QE487_03975 [Fluviicola sp.]|nr:hypothetical protein [Fluviicola sp.]